MRKRSFQKIEFAQELPSQHVVDFIFHAERLHGLSLGMERRAVKVSPSIVVLPSVVIVERREPFLIDSKQRRLAGPTATPPASTAAIADWTAASLASRS
jgi:hypothetical protein